MGDLPQLQWSLPDGTLETSGGGASFGGVAAIVETGLKAGQREFWLHRSDGASLAIVTNTERAMVMFMHSEDDPGEHLVDPGAGSVYSDGYLLSNGQMDSYLDADTVPLHLAISTCTHLIHTGRWPKTAHIAIDR